MLLIQNYISHGHLDFKKKIIKESENEHSLIPLNKRTELNTLI